MFSPNGGVETVARPSFQMRLGKRDSWPGEFDFGIPRQFSSSAPKNFPDLPILVSRRFTASLQWFRWHTDLMGFW
jgi:hypothetical protein